MDKLDKAILNTYQNADKGNYLEIPEITADPTADFFDDRQDEYKEYLKQEKELKQFYRHIIDNYLEEGLLFKCNHTVFTLTKGIDNPEHIRFSSFFIYLTDEENGILNYDAIRHHEYPDLNELFEKESPFLQTSRCCLIGEDIRKQEIQDEKQILNDGRSDFNMNDEMLKKALGIYFKDVIDKDTDMNWVADQAKDAFNKWMKIDCVIDELLAEAYDKTMYGGYFISFDDIQERAKDLFNMDLSYEDIEIETEDRIATDPFLLQYDLDTDGEEKGYDVGLGYGRILSDVNFNEDEELEMMLHKKEMELFESYKKEKPLEYDVEKRFIILPDGSQKNNVYTYKQAKKLYDDFACQSVLESKEYKDYEEKMNIFVYTNKINNEYKIPVTDTASKYRLLSDLKKHCNKYMELLESGVRDTNWLHGDSLDSQFKLMKDVVSSLPKNKVPNGFEWRDLDELKGDMQRADLDYDIKQYVDRYDAFVRDYDLYEWKDNDLDNPEVLEELKSKQIQDLKSRNADYMMDYLKEVKGEGFNYGDECELNDLMSDYEKIHTDTFMFMGVEDFAKWLNEIEIQQDEQQEEDSIQV